jgi:hypothetical protein
MLSQYQCSSKDYHSLVRKAKKAPQTIQHNTIHLIA